MSEETPTKVVRDFSTIAITQTYEGYDPFEFEFQRVFRQEVREARQHFYGLTVEQREEEEYQHRIFVLASQLKKAPKGLDQIGYIDTGEPARDFTTFAATINNEDFIGSLYVEWQDKAYPKELLSTT